MAALYCVLTCLFFLPSHSKFINVYCVVFFLKFVHILSLIKNILCSCFSKALPFVDDFNNKAYLVVGGFNSHNTLWGDTVKLTTMEMQLNCGLCRRTSLSFMMPRMNHHFIVLIGKEATTQSWCLHHLESPKILKNPSPNPYQDLNTDLLSLRPDQF